MEKKQDDMRHEYQVKHPEYADKIKFYIGDVRDLQSCKNAMHGVDYIFHAAALKRVTSCEFFPRETVKTNIIGTDKAAYPVNAMGKTKSLEESVAIAKSRYSGKLRFTVHVMVMLCVAVVLLFLCGLIRLEPVVLLLS